jgi:hypothetical protein
MASTKTWNGITPELFACVKSRSDREHGTKYEPANANQGTATTSVRAVGTIVLGFDLQSGGALTYTIQKKPFVVPESRIWDGIDETIKGCRK